MTFHNGKESWRLDLNAGTVQIIQIDFRLGLLLVDGPNTAKVFISVECGLITQNGLIKLVPDKAPSLCPILSYINAKVSEIKICKTGRLELVFESGDLLEVQADNSYEAWKLESSIGIMIVCSPGGSISLFNEISSRSDQQVRKSPE